MIGLLMDRRVTVVRRGVTGTDRLGKPVIGEVGRQEAVSGRLEESSSVEGAEYVSGRYTALLDPSTALSSGDLIVSDGVTYAVDGIPERRGVPGFPVTDHVFAVLKVNGGTS